MGYCKVIEDMLNEVVLETQREIEAYYKYGIVALRYCRDYGAFR